MILAAWVKTGIAYYNGVLLQTHPASKHHFLHEEVKDCPLLAVAQRGQTIEDVKILSPLEANRQCFWIESGTPEELETLQSAGYNLSRTPTVPGADQFLDWVTERSEEIGRASCRE